MTSWSDAFRKAIKVSILYVVWIVIGGIIIAAGVYFGTYDTYYPNFWVIYGAGLIGGVLMIFGGIASIFKVVGDMFEESRGYQYSGSHGRCSNCGATVSPGLKFCPECGNRVIYFIFFARAVFKLK